MTKYVAEYYGGGHAMIGFFEAKSEQEVRDYLIRKYGEIVEISQIVEQTDQSASISSILKEDKNTIQATKLDEFAENKEGKKT